MEMHDPAPGPAYAAVAVDRPSSAGPAGGGGLVLTYRCPPGLVIRPGHLALVPLGARVVAGVVVETAAAPPADLDPARIREILRLVDPQPVLTADQLALGAWIAAYYHCPLYAALALMLPPGVGSYEVVTVALTPAGTDRTGTDGAHLSTRQARLLAVLAEAGGVLGVDQLRARLGRTDAGALVRRLEHRGLVERRSALLRPRVQPRHELFVRRLPSPANRPVPRLGPIQTAALAWLELTPCPGGPA